MHSKNHKNKHRYSSCRRLQGNSNQCPHRNNSHSTGMAPLLFPSPIMQRSSTFHYRIHEQESPSVSGHDSMNDETENARGRGKLAMVRGSMMMLMPMQLRRMRLRLRRRGRQRREGEWAATRGMPMVMPLHCNAFEY